MKNLFRFLTLSVMALTVSVSAFAYDADGNPNKKREIDGAPGSVAYREYQLVRYAENGPNGTALSQGDVIVADCVSDDGITVAVAGSTNSVDAVRGVVVSVTIPTCDVTGTTAVIDFGRRNWGYVQVKGLCTKVNMLASALPLAGSSTYASLTGRNAGAVVAGNSGQKPLGFALDAGASGSANDVYIDL